MSNREERKTSLRWNLFRFCSLIVNDIDGEFSLLIERIHRILFYCSTIRRDNIDWERKNEEDEEEEEQETFFGLCLSFGRMFKADIRLHCLVEKDCHFLPLLGQLRLSILFLRVSILVLVWLLLFLFEYVIDPDNSI